MLNCWVILAAGCLDDENEIPLKVIASFSSMCIAVTSIPLIVLHILVRYLFWSIVSTKSLNFFRLCTQMRFWMSLFSRWRAYQAVEIVRHLAQKNIFGPRAICMCARRARLCVWIGLTNITLLMNPWQYKFYFFDSLYGITHGFDITLDLLLMAWNFKDISFYSELYR